ncbi:MAG: Gx transporter family protein [Peptoniphilus sp.]|uniref:Gx transporter family protein n=1 Tax=Peptoniphilus sp. TaxID=1971214 RepID=UPI002A75BADA|nr:Gx transporter family protein [Peptoniphilus sp.]MDY2987172.1 Gx transporter family protein [Peptoniphilus sp.]
MRIKKMIFLSLLVSLGLVIGLFEMMLPTPAAIPGAKLGLSNMVVLITILFFGNREGIVVAALKSILLVIVTGSVTSFIFSFTGAMLSTVSMSLANSFLKKYISTVGISLIGSAFHNMGQVLAACIVLNTFSIISYLPLLLVLGIFTGYFVGVASEYSVKNLSVTFKGNINE